MARYIDADEFYEGFCIYAMGQDKNFIKAVEQVLEDTPTADVEEVVRCEKCKFNVANMEKDEYDTTDYDGKDIVCSYFMTDGLQPTDFCSHGERK